MHSAIQRAQIQYGCTQHSSQPGPLCRRPTLLYLSGRHCAEQVRMSTPVVALDTCHKCAAATRSMACTSTATQSSRCELLLLVFMTSNMVHSRKHTFPVSNDLVRSGSAADRVQSVPGCLHGLQLRLYSLHHNTELTLIYAYG